jgi:hypothetical protein
MSTAAIQTTAMVSAARLPQKIAMKMVNASESFTVYFPGPASNLWIAAADIHGMSSPEERLMKAVWGKTEVMYDRRQKKPRRTGWRGGRRASDWPEAFGTGRQKRQAKPVKLIM